ncbi:MAG: DUF4097 domain-containing protein [Treponema sp.]|jgi:hypothetical protein|nr:DUF4097 domain-containing protein [Treponema sp.]
MKIGLIGFWVLLCTGSIVVKGFASGKGEVVHTQTIPLHRVSTLSVAYTASTIQVRTGEPDVFVLKEYMSQNTEALKATYSHENGNLVITGGRRGIGLGQTPEIVLAIPPAFSGNLLLSLESGNLSIETSLISAGTIQINHKNGTLEMGLIRGEDIHITHASGTFMASNLEASGTCILNLTSGTGTVHEIRSNTSTVTVISGSLAIPVSTGRGSYTVTSGTITLGKHLLSGNMALEAVSGTIEMGIPVDGVYRIDASATSGQVIETSGTVENVLVFSPMGSTTPTVKQAIIGQPGIAPQYAITAKACAGSIIFSR